MKYTRNVIKIGNSYAVTLPFKYVNKKEIKEGDEIIISLEDS